MKLATPTRRNTNRAGSTFFLALALCWVLPGAMSGCKEEEKAALGTVIAPPRITIREKITQIVDRLRNGHPSTFTDLMSGKKSRIKY